MSSGVGLTAAVTTDKETGTCDGSAHIRLVYPYIRLVLWYEHNELLFDLKLVKKKIYVLTRGQSRVATCCKVCFHVVLQ